MRRSFLWVFIPVFVLAFVLEGALIAYHFTHPHVDIDAIIRQGNEAFHAGNYDLAIQHYSEALKADPKSGKAYTFRGMTWAWKKDYDKAIADYTAAIAIQPDDSSTYYDRGLAYQTKHDLPNALKDFSTLVQLKPGEARGYTLRGNIYFRMKDYDRALADFQKLAELNLHTPGEADAHYDVGTAFSWKHDYQDAATEYGKAIDLYTLTAPHLARAYDARAMAYRHLGNYDAALADCNKVMTFDTHNRAAYVQRGFVYVATHDEQKADADFQASFDMETEQHRASAYNNVAWTLCTSPDEAMRDGQLAAKYAEKSCELSSWQHPEDIDTLAAACAETGDFDSAVKWEQKYLATSGLDAKAVEEAKPRLDLYVAHQPFREAPFGSPKTTP